MEQQIRKLLSAIVHPETQQDIVASGVVEQLSAQCSPVTLSRAAERTVAAKTDPLSTGDADGELISIRIEGESFTEASSSHATQRPKIESFSGYLYNSATSTWDPYSGSCLGNMWPQDSYAIYRIEAPESGTYRLETPVDIGMIIDLLRLGRRL